jgi:hypothetical protein
MCAEALACGRCVCRVCMDMCVLSPVLYIQGCYRIDAWVEAPMNHALKRCVLVSEFTLGPSSQLPYPA